MMRFGRMPAALLAGALISMTGAARAEPLGSHQPHIEGSLGVRVSKVGSSGYDAFATSDELVQLSLGVGATAIRAEQFSLAGVAFWDYGGHSSQARGEATQLIAQRLTIGPEFRYHVLPLFYVFVHALPAFAFADASLDDTVARATREARHWSYGLDGAVGAAFELYGRRSGESIQPRLWAMAEGGYGYLSSTHLGLTAAGDSGAPQRTAAVDLGQLSLGGPYARVSVAVSF
ncbi:MAG TPA: hypothetical protein VNW92_31650 [Polyangiaceae bacterium]|jgi:hypothetical protein|nr:hypothetical protein [Polyangiaceae bacterium]